MNVDVGRGPEGPLFHGKFQISEGLAFSGCRVVRELECPAVFKFSDNSYTSGEAIANSPKMLARTQSLPGAGSITLEDTECRRAWDAAGHADNYR